MTMHLAKGLTTTSTKKQKPSKFTKAQMNQFESDLMEYNRKCKREGRHSDRMTLEEFIDYKHGVIKESPKPTKPSNYKPQPEPCRRESSTAHIKSLSTDVGGACTLAPKKEYTGTAILGIATMHKSNAVPVFNTEQAEEISRMRR